MQLSEVKRIASEQGIKTAKMKKEEIIRAIQRSEGNFDCFGSALSGACTQEECLWRKDCLKKV